MLGGGLYMPVKRIAECRLWDEVGLLIGMGMECRGRGGIGNVN